jgi:RNA polymerase sigma-70 factor (ECF subfamily)
MKSDINHVKDLQQRIASGDQPAFEGLYRLFFPRLQGFAMMYLHKKELAEEVVNDVMLKIWNKRSDILLIENIETYLFTAVRNHSLNHLAQFSHYHVVYEPENGTMEVINLNDPSRLLEWKEIHHRLNLAIETLPDQCRTVFKLIREEGFRYKEVAEILGVSPRTVETQLFRAVKKLDKIIEMYMAGCKE